MAITTNGKVSITNLQVGSSADLASIISDESGTGVLAFTNSPTFTTPTLGTASATAIELGHATDTTISRASAGVVAIEGVNVVTETATQTLTNKTLTSPVITGAVFNDGSVVFEGATADNFETTLTVTDPTADRTITFQDATGTVVLRDTTDTLSNKTLTAPKFADSGFIADANGNELIAFPSTVASAVNQVVIENAATGDGATTGQPIIRAQGDDTNISLNLVPKGSGVVQANGVAVVTTSGTQTLTNKTLTSPTIDTSTINSAILKSPEERMNIVASAATGTINIDITTSTIWYYTSNATANHTLNFRFSSGATLNDSLTTGDAITVVWLNTNGATPYYPNVIQVDGSTITPKFQNGTSFSAGNASSIDAYSFTIIKTASATFTVLASQTKFA